MSIKNWSTTADSNNAAVPYGAPEGWTSDQVNNWGRQTMADVRSFYETMEWRDWGLTPTYATASTFTMSGDQTGVYLVGRRIRCTDASTLYGTISASSYDGSSTTTVTVTLDSGSLSSSLTATALGFDLTNSDVQTLSDFGVSTTPNGYQKLPGGLIMQWGTYSLTTALAAYSYPIAFPTGALLVMGGNTYSTSSQLAVISYTASQFQAIASNASSYFVFAIGY